MTKTIIISSLLLFMNSGAWANCGKAFIRKVEINPLEGAATREPGYFSGIVDAIKQQARVKLKFKRINQKKDISWKGPSLPRFVRASFIPYEEWLSAENLKYSKEDQGREALGEILTVFVQLGMEQGQRYTTHSQEWGGIKSALDRIGALLKDRDYASVKVQIESVKGDLAKLAEGKGVVSPNAAKPGPEWPADGSPLELQQIIEPLVSAVFQAYRVSGTQNPKQDLADVLVQALPKAFLQGRQHFHNQYSSFELFRSQLSTFEFAVKLQRQIGGEYLVKAHQDLTKTFDRITQPD